MAASPHSWPPKFSFMAFLKLPSPGLREEKCLAFSIQTPVKYWNNRTDLQHQTSLEFPVFSCYEYLGVRTEIYKPIMATFDNLWRLLGPWKNWEYLSNLVFSSGPLTEVSDGRKRPINILLHTMHVCVPVYVPQLIVNRLYAVAEMQKMQHSIGKIWRKFHLML